jgi:adenosine deaminase
MKHYIFARASLGTVCYNAMLNNVNVKRISMNINKFIHNLPKAELHVHLEGTLEPELMLALAERNNVSLLYNTVDAIQRARAVGTYESFAESFVEGTSVLQTGQDFYDIAYAYLKKVSSQGVLHAEITFDTQTYSSRNIQAGTIISALHAATIDAQRHYGISSLLIWGCPR